MKIKRRPFASVCQNESWAYRFIFMQIKLILFNQVSDLQLKKIDNQINQPFKLRLA